jgi:hypothetical protein
MRVGFLATLVAAAAGGLYEYEDGAVAFDWLHSILTGMNVTVGGRCLFNPRGLRSSGLLRVLRIAGWRAE